MSDKPDVVRIGSTDVCCKGACLASRYYGGAPCVCEPDSKDFFQELPVVITVPYRTVLITGIAPTPEDAKQPIKNDREWF